MRELPTVVEVGDLVLPATCTLPEEGPAIGGIIPLHGATAPDRDFFLYTHLASVASREGWAVLRYDRRPIDRGTIPFEVQAADAIAASDRLREVAQLPREPIGIWGVSQGAWSATVAAADSDDVAFLILVGYSGMSPGEQMRYFTANRLRDHGHDERALAALAALRDTFEAFLRGDLDHTTAQRHVDEARSQPWFEHSWVPAELPQRSEVSFPGLFDFEPIGPLRRARCPTLAIWGADDVEVPPDVGRDVVEQARRDGPATTRCEVLDGAGHTLTVGGEDDVAALHPRYEPLLIEWLHAQAAGPGDP